MEIRQVTLQTKNLAKMKAFYIETLGMSLTQESEESFQVAVGSSLLEFTSMNVEGEPYYHFAFNIPSNKFKEAKTWVKGKVELNVENGEDQVEFSHLLADSIYFYDPAGNIVELIS